jgi:filamentous hemagglutinin family protein
MTRSLRTVLLTSAALLTCGLPATAGPDGANVVAGSASVQGQGTSSVTINQTSNRAIINWQHFNIGTGEKAQFIQPSSSSVALNRVTGSQDPTVIQGQLTANGQIFIVNPNGILFGASAVVNTAGLLATTSDITNANFMAGKYQFDIPGKPNASVVNEGRITATSGGFAALVAPGVRNSGTITATVGKVALAAGNTYTLDFYGDNLVNVSVADSIAATVIDVGTKQPLTALVKNDGTLSANGGRVELTAASARKVVDSVINNTGVIEANAVGKGSGGTIVLSAATGSSKGADAPKQVVKVGGTLSAGGKDAGQKGGKVVVTGEHIELTGAKVDVAGAAGGGTALIGGDWGGGKPTAGLVTHPGAKLESESVPTATTVTVDKTSVIDASATQSGNGGKVIVWSDQMTTFNGTILATGGPQGGDGGFAEVSGAQLDFTGSADLRAMNGTGTAGTLLLDPRDFYINSNGVAPLGSSAISAATVQSQLANANVTLTTGLFGNQQGNLNVNAPVTWSSSNTLTLLALNNININAAVTANKGGLTLTAGNTITATDKVDVGRFTLVSGSWNQVATQLAPTLPTFKANDFRILGGSFLRALSGDGLDLPYQITDVYGLQGIGSSSLLGKKFALANDIDASGTANWNGSAGFAPIGTILNPFTGSFDGKNHVIGELNVQTLLPHAGLFGVNAGTIRNVGLIDVGVTATVTTQFAGALAGSNRGTITNTYATGSVGNSPNANVLFAEGGFGGLVGINESNGTISQSHANVAVHATGPKLGYIDGGGLVGQNLGAITQSYAEGPVTGTSASASKQYLGGLVGWNRGGSISQSYALGSVTGSGANVVGGGLVGTNVASIVETYATGAVSVTGTNPTMGGLVGSGNGGVTKSYWDTETTGQKTSAGGTGAKGLTTTELMQASNYTGWNIGQNGSWFMINGQTRPFLTSEASATITNTHQLQLMAMDLGGTYTLANNIDFGPNPTNASGMWGATGFAPIGSEFGSAGSSGTPSLGLKAPLSVPTSGPFTGSLNGNNHTITNLTIAPTANGLNNIGLFGVIGTTGNVSNLTLANANITANPNRGSSGEFVGTLAGQNTGTIRNVTVTNGFVDGLDLAAITAGGLVGQNGILGVTSAALIEHSHVDKTTVRVGNGTFCNSQSCEGTGFNNAGGLAGSNAAMIRDSSADGGEVLIASHGFAGGLVGVNQNAIFNNNGPPNFISGAVIENSSSSNKVTSHGVAVGVGGLVGSNAPKGQVVSSRASGDVLADASVPPNNDCSNNCGFVSAGGLVGQNQGTITGNDNVPALNQDCGPGQSCATGNVQVGSHGTGGGLVGTNDGVITNSFAKIGTITGASGQGDLNNGEASTNLGGLAGQNQGKIEGSFASGDVGDPLANNLNAGGLVGDNSGTILSSRATGNVRAGNDSNAGGLVSNNSGFNDCNGCFIGDGFAFRNTAKIENSHAEGAVTVGDRSVAGGLAGSGDGLFRLTTASGNVTGGADSVLGGLVGALGTDKNENGTAAIIASQASGTVRSTGPNSVVGGLVGANFGLIDVFTDPGANNLPSQASASKTLSAQASVTDASSTPASFTIDNVSKSTGAVIGTSDSFLGGLVGINLGLVRNSSTTATATVTGNGDNNLVGGLVGLNLGLVENSKAAGNATSDANSGVGTLIGANATFIGFTAGVFPISSFAVGSTFPVGSFTNSDASGTASGGANSDVGGLVGRTNPTTVPGFPSIVNGCNDPGCVALVTGILGPINPTNPVLPPLPLPPLPQVTPPPVQPPPTFILPPPSFQQASLTQGNVVDIQQPTTQGTTQSTPGTPGRPQQPGAPRNLGGNAGVWPSSGMPPPGETRFLKDQIVLQIGSNVSRETVDRLARELGLTIIASQELSTIGTTAYQFQITGGRSVAEVIRAFENNRVPAFMQPNYQYALTQEAEPKDVDLTASIPPQVGPAQYILRKMRLNETHQLARGSNILIGVIDSEVDANHPDLQGAIVRRFNAAGGEDKPHAHGTGMAGAIAAQRRLTGTAPGSRVLAVNAFSATASSAESTTFQILKGIDWAINNGARVLNMSFAGPFDPTLQRAMKNARDKGIVLVAAAGNAGPKSPPLFPGADPNVIAVTATDMDDKLFTMANRGRYIALAAPGVDILVPAPAGSYQTTTGTSVATALVSGVVALLLERDPTLTPNDIRKILTTTAKRMNGKDRDDGYGSGVIDVYQAVTSLSAAKP